MLVINGHWQDAACWEKGWRMMNGWSLSAPHPGFGLHWGRRHTGMRQWRQDAHSGAKSSHSKVSSQAGVKSSCQSLGQTLFGRRVSFTGKEDREGVILLVTASENVKAGLVSASATACSWVRNA